MEKKGIKDMMEKQRYRPSHLQESLLESEVPGNWSGKSGLQNTYNLIEGRVMPKDGYVFIFLSEFLKQRLRDVVLRYTTKEETITKHNGNEINW